MREKQVAKGTARNLHKFIERYILRERGQEKKEHRHLYQHRRPKTDDQFNEERLEKERKLNAILDKINRSGFDSLSKSEKDFLNQQSR